MCYHFLWVMNNFMETPRQIAMIFKQLDHILLLCYIFLRLLQITSSLGLAGPYECVVETNVGNCEGTNFPIRFNWQIVRMNKTTRVSSGNITYPFAWDEKVSQVASLQQWTTGGWKTITLTETPYACKGTQEKFPDLFETWANACGAPTSCPWPKGTYYMNSMPSCMKPKNFPMLPYGKFRIQANASREGEQVGCVFIDLEIQPSEMFGKRGRK